MQGPFLGYGHQAQMLNIVHVTAGKSFSPNCYTMPIHFSFAFVLGFVETTMYRPYWLHINFVGPVLPTSTP